MKSIHTCGASLLALAALANAGHLTVTLDTRVLVGSNAGPFSVGIQLADGSLSGDGNNAVVVSNFQFDGGSPTGSPCVAATSTALGDLSSSIAATDLSVFSICQETFTPGNTLSFDVTYTNNVETGTPDEFVMVILDKYGQPIPTTGGIALLEIDFDSATPTVLTFAGDPNQYEQGNGGSGIAIPAPVVTILSGPPPGGLQFYPIAPCRLVDTRGAGGGFSGVSPFSGPSIPAGGTITIPVQSAAELNTTAPAPCGIIRSTAQAYSLNITLVPAQNGSVNYLSIWPTGVSRPIVSTLNDLDGLIIANAAIVPAGTTNGAISVFNFGPATTDVVIDMNGYFAPPASGLQFYPTAPCRLVDTRGPGGGFSGISPFSGPSIPAGGTITIPVQSAAELNTTAPAPCGMIPSTAQAYSLNATLVPAENAPVNYLSIWPTGVSRPIVSTLNDLDSLIIANAAIVPAGTTNGAISVFNFGPATTDVVIDMNGYFAPPASGLQFYPIAPCRLVDTRGAGGGFSGVSPFSGPSIPAGGTITIPVQSAAELNTTAPAPCGMIPSTAQAYSLNVTLVPAQSGPVNYLSIWPTGVSRPIVSTLNDLDGLIVANAAIVPAGTTNGAISVFNFGPSTTDVVIDMNGYFGP